MALTVLFFHWLLFTGYCLLVTVYCLLITGYWLLITELISPTEDNPTPS